MSLNHNNEFTFVAFVAVLIKGNAWRDIDSADHLDTFLVSVFIAGKEPQEILNELADELGVDEPGRVL